MERLGRGNFLLPQNRSRAHARRILNLMNTAPEPPKPLTVELFHNHKGKPILYCPNADDCTWAALRLFSGQDEDAFYLGIVADLMLAGF